MVSLSRLVALFLVEHQIRLTIFHSENKAKSSVLNKDAHQRETITY